MKNIDKDGLLLCELQARTFELSIEKTDSSSEIFIRRFINSEIVKEMDNMAILDWNLQPMDILERIEEEYGVSTYGSTKYSKNEMYWIGYVYRYYAYTYEISSIQAYKIIKPKELRSLYLPYHTLDVSQAIERILESKGMLLNEEERLQKQYEIYRAIRMENKN
ncbi:MAG: antitoxin [Firmicutes bacterium]|nr:antitoxin [Bacillota bacterium]